MNVMSFGFFQKIFVFLFSTIIVLFSNAYSQSNKNIIISKDTVWLNLAFECCDCGADTSKGSFYSQFSFCSDGFEQPFGNPNLIQLNFDNFLLSYDKPIYDLSCFGDGLINQINEVESKGINPKNIVSFYNGRFKRVVNRKMKKVHKSLANFDGKFYYKLFRIQLVREPLGESNKMLPLFNFSNQSKIIMDKNVFIYCVIQILKIEPITKEQYLGR